MESRWIYGVHVESIWNLWGSVKYRDGGCLPWCRIVVRRLGATSLAATGTWFPLLGAGGFHGGGSRFCACGRPFMFILGRMLLFGQLLSLCRYRCLGIRTMTNNRFESVVHHLVTTSLSAMWHLGYVSVKTKEGDNLLCTVTTLSVITVGWCCVVGVVGWAS